VFVLALHHKKLKAVTAACRRVFLRFIQRERWQTLGRIFGARKHGRRQHACHAHRLPTAAALRGKVLRESARIRVSEILAAEI